MIRFVQGDIFASDAEAVVNTVNCVGVMGKGIALQFKKAYPDNFKAYAEACKNGHVVPGQVFVFDRGTMTPPRYIINFPTKRHWKEASRIADIRSGLASLKDQIKQFNISSIAIPPLGCGNGGLNWRDVRAAIEHELSSLDQVDVIVYEPAGTPSPATMLIRTAQPKLTLLKAALLDAIRQYTELDFSLTRLEIQKIAYFLNESWPGYKLDYAAGKYGPFSTKLEHTLQDMDGHWLIGCGDNADPRTEIELSDIALDAVEQFMAKYDPQMPYIKSKNRALEVMQGFETPFGMELLSTTHWLAAHNAPPAANVDEAYSMIQNWNQHKKDLFDRAHVACAWARLKDHGWING